jgi:uncharacterized protein (TIGR03435 family)
MRTQDTMARTPITLALVLSLAALPSLTRLRAQTSQPTAPTYEVASIKLDPTGDPTQRVTWNYMPDGFIAKNVTLELVIRSAYGIKPWQIVGAPKWFDQTEFEISARIEKSEADKLQTLTKDQANQERAQMLQSLLADRFNLKVHHETAEGAVYVLTVAKNGPKFKEAAPSESAPSAATDSSGQAPKPQIIMGDGKLAFNGAPLAPFVGFLSQQLGRPVEDKTGLTAKYDFALPWLPDEFQLPAYAQSQQQGSAPLPDAPVSIFTILQDQLGLRLESAKGPIDTIVIDHVEPPTPNCRALKADSQASLPECPARPETSSSSAVESRRRDLVG